MLVHGKPLGRETTNEGLDFCWINLWVMWRRDGDSNLDTLRYTLSKRAPSATRPSLRSK